MEDWEKIRAQAAIAAMQSLISKQSGGYVAGYTTRNLAERAVEYACSLVSELKKL